MIEAGSCQQRENRARPRRVQGAHVPCVPGARADCGGDADTGIRPVYWPRQAVSDEDLTAGQYYLRRLWREHNLLNHGAGVACGLEVQSAGTAASGHPQVVVTQGYAVGPQGDEIYVPDDHVVVIDCVPLKSDQCLDPDAGPGEQAVYLVIRYAETPACPAPHYGARCDPLPVCQYRRVEAGFEITCQCTPPPSVSLDCQALMDLLACYGPPASLGDISPLTLCPPESAPSADGQPWVTLARLYLDEEGRLDVIDYSVRQRLFASQILECLVRCMASLSLGAQGGGTRADADHSAEFDWHSSLRGEDVALDAGGTFEPSRRLGVQVAPVEELAPALAVAPVGELPTAPATDQPVETLLGIGPIYRSRLERIGITTIGQLAVAQPAVVAAALNATARRALAFVEAARDACRKARDAPRAAQRSLSG